MTNVRIRNLVIHPIRNVADVSDGQGKISKRRSLKRDGTAKIKLGGKVANESLEGLQDTQDELVDGEATSQSPRPDSSDDKPAKVASLQPLTVRLHDEFVESHALADTSSNEYDGSQKTETPHRETENSWGLRSILWLSWHLRERQAKNSPVRITMFLRSQRKRKQVRRVQELHSQIIRRKSLAPQIS
jgi:hypothetical protein